MGSSSPKFGVKIPKNIWVATNQSWPFAQDGMLLKGTDWQRIRTQEKNPRSKTSRKACRFEASLHWRSWTHPAVKIYTLGVQRPLNKCSFRKDHYFSRDLQSTIPGDYIFNGLWLPGIWVKLVSSSPNFPDENSQKNVWVATTYIHKHVSS